MDRSAYIKRAFESRKISETIENFVTLAQFRN